MPCREVAQLVRQEVPIRRPGEELGGDDDMPPGRPGAGAGGDPQCRWPPGRELTPLEHEVRRVHRSGRHADLHDKRIERSLPGGLACGLLDCSALDPLPLTREPGSGFLPIGVDPARSFLNQRSAIAPPSSPAPLAYCRGPCGRAGVLLSCVLWRHRLAGARRGQGAFAA